MRCLCLFVALFGLAGAGGVASAKPAADLVIVWAPSTNIAPIATAAREAGAAVIDRSPPPPTPAAIAKVVARGIEAYDQTKWDVAWEALELARDAVDRTGGEGMSTTQLSDLFLYRGMVRDARGDLTGYDELVAAIVLDPNRTLDEARFAPKVIDDVNRARKAVESRPRATLSIDSPAGCTIVVDGATTETNTPRIAGRHWLRVTCPGHAPWGARVDVTAPTTNVVVRPVPLVAPTDADLLIQARTAGAIGLVSVEMRGEVASIRLLGADGRERDRRTISARGGIEPIVAAVRELLTPPVRVRWYKSRWAWAAGAGILAAGIAIPLTILATRDTTTDSATIKLPFPEPRR